MNSAVYGREAHNAPLIARSSALSGKINDFLGILAPRQGGRLTSSGLSAFRNSSKTVNNLIQYSNQVMSLSSRPGSSSSESVLVVRKQPGALAILQGSRSWNVPLVLQSQGESA